MVQKVEQDCEDGECMHTSNRVCILLDPRGEFFIRLYFRTRVMFPRCQKEALTDIYQLTYARMGSWGRCRTDNVTKR
jgi:hypothetical protein